MTELSGELYVLRERENTKTSDTDRTTNSGEGRTQVLLDLIADGFCSLNRH